MIDDTSTGADVRPVHRRRRTAVALASVAALTLVLASCGGSSSEDSAPADSSEPLKIRVATTASVSNLAVWVADEKGLFDKHGVDVTAEQINTTTISQIPVLLGKQYDVGVTTAPNFLTAAEKGIDIIASSGSVQFQKQEEPSINVVASKKSGITKPKDLEGKRLAATSLAGNINLATMKWLIDEGVDIDKIKVVQANAPNMPDLLKAGTVDAVEVNMPFVGVLLAGDNVNVGYPLAAVSDPVHMSFWISDRTWATKNKEGLKAFRDAMDEAAKWIQDNHDEAISLALEKAKLPAEYREHISLPIFTSKLTPSELEAWSKAMNTVNGFTTDKKMDDLILGD